MDDRSVDEAIWRTRLLVFVAIPAALLCALVAWAAAISTAVLAALALLGDGAPPGVFVPILATFVDLLLGAVLLTFAIGVYQLFVRPLSSQQWRSGVPRALHFGTIHELRDRMLVYLVLIASLALIAKIPDAHGTLGIGIALVGVASLLLLITAWRAHDHTRALADPPLERRTLEFPAGMFLDEMNATSSLSSPRDRKLSDPFLAAERITRPRIPALGPRLSYATPIVAVGIVAALIGVATMRPTVDPRAAVQPSTRVDESRQRAMERPLRAAPSTAPRPVVTALPVPAPALRAPPHGAAVLKVRCRTGVILHVFLDGDDTATSCAAHDRIRTTAGPHVVGLFSPSTARMRELRRELEPGETRLWVKP